MKTGAHELPPGSPGGLLQPLTGVTMRSIRHAIVGIGLALLGALSAPTQANVFVLTPSAEVPAAHAFIIEKAEPVPQPDAISVRVDNPHALKQAPTIARHLFGGGDSPPGRRTGGDEEEEETALSESADPARITLVEPDNPA
jgi:hypothetical protein